MSHIKEKKDSIILIEKSYLKGFWLACCCAVLSISIAHVVKSVCPHGVHHFVIRGIECVGIIFDGTAFYGVVSTKPWKNDSLQNVFDQYLLKVCLTIGLVCGFLSSLLQSID